VEEYAIMKRIAVSLCVSLSGPLSLTLRLCMSVC